MKKNILQHIILTSIFFLSALSKNTYAQAFFDNTFDADQNLPVKLLSFTANKNEGDVYVAWTTATEINNSHFEVERSFDGTQFEVIGTVAGRGNTTAETKYNFIDKKVPNITLYYRLKQFDFDGTATVSPVAIIKIERVNESSISVYPNPVRNNSITLRFENMPTGRYAITLIGTNGARMHQQIFEHRVLTEITQLYLQAKPAKGVYILNINNGVESRNQKIIID